MMIFSYCFPAPLKATNDAAITSTFTLLLLLTSLYQVNGTSVSVVREGYTKGGGQTVGSRLTSGGVQQPARYFNGCMSITYEDSCNYPGTKLSMTYGSRIVLNGNEVHVCSRTRITTNCNNCFLNKCNPTSSTNYYGTTTKYSLQSSSGSIAAFSGIEDSSNDTPCLSVCTEDNGSLTSTSDKSTCSVTNDGWLLVSSTFDAPCKQKSACLELEVIKGCEGALSDMVGTKFKPYTNVIEDCNGAVDKTRSVYKSEYESEDGYALWIFYEAGASYPEWIAVRSKGCGSWDAGKGGTFSGFYEGSFGGEDTAEPYLEPDERIRCYRGYKDTRSYDFSIQCNKFETKSGGTGSEAKIGAVIVGVVMMMSMVV